MKIQFVRLLNDKGTTYESYVDFWTCVRAVGFEIIEQNNVVPSTDTTIIFPMRNAHAIAIAQWPRPESCRAVLWQLERPGEHETPWEYLPGRFDQCWISCPLAYKKMAHVNSSRYTPIGSCPELVPERYREKVHRPAPQYDFACFSYLYGERNHRCIQIK